MNSIPVIGVPIVNGAHWLKRLVDSIDYPVDDLVIINNNGRGEITEQLDEIVNQGSPFVKTIKVCHMPSNIGCPGAWNLIIKCYMMCPYWIIVNNDVAFTPGLLQKMNEAAQVKDGFGTIHVSAVLNESEVNESMSGKFNFDLLPPFDLFLIKDWVVQTYGLFDENCYPAYCEDTDYIMRLRTGSVRAKIINERYFHGDTYYYEQSGSQTQKSETEDINSKVFEAYQANLCYYIPRKWGDNWKIDPDIKLSNLSCPLNPLYDLAFCRSKNLGF